ncbi:MAG: NAD(P)/FAD-dependent oxidoreductase, partial [Calditrichia bacterium]|nr:NAD(P)/FAD-dependent oxidoreductase [Calditrichia bacterium]
ISNYWQPGNNIIINFLPDIDLKQQIKNWQIEKPKTALRNLLSTLLPKRLTLFLLENKVDNKPVNQYNKKEILEISKIFHQWTIFPTGTEGYKKAEITRGGVDTDELSSKTFEVKKTKGLFFIGEVVDVSGWLGGYNLHWAWASGYCAGQFV